MTKAERAKNKDKQIMIRLDAETKQQLETEAAKQRRKPAELARLFIEDRLAGKNV